MGDRKRWIGRCGAAALLVASACLVAGCPHHTPPASETAADAALRKDNLFATFDADARELSLVNAYLLELACYVGDKGTFELDRTLAAWGFGRRREFRDLRTSTYGFVASNDRMVLVTFGGTDVMNVRDLLSDADALQLVYDPRYCETQGARVHRGFRDSLNSVIDGVIDEVRRQAEAPAPAATTAPTTAPDGRGTVVTPPRRKKVWVAGHSRGGAFAVLASAAFAREVDFPEVAGAYTFGQPRVGNGPFVQALTEGVSNGRAGVPLFRFVNKDDPVPMVPPEAPAPAGRLGISLDYQHGGTPVVLRADGRVARGSSADERRSLSLRDLPDPRSAGASIGNHYQPAYQAAIYAALSDPSRVEEPAWRAAVPAGGVSDVLPKPVR